MAGGVTEAQESLQLAIWRRPDAYGVKHADAPVWLALPTAARSND